MELGTVCGDVRLYPQNALTMVNEEDEDEE